MITEHLRQYDMRGGEVTDLGGGLSEEDEVIGEEVGLGAVRRVVFTSDKPLK